jgi:hypothetical protein
MNKKLKGKIIEIYGSQFEFSQVVKTHESDISRVIRGRKQLSIEDRQKWAEVLSCKPDDIFKE